MDAPDLALLRLLERMDDALRAIRWKVEMIEERIDGMESDMSDLLSAVVPSGAALDHEHEMASPGSEPASGDSRLVPVIGDHPLTARRTEHSP